MEHCGGGDLQDYMRRDVGIGEGDDYHDINNQVGKPLHEAKARRVFQQLTSAVQYCHSLNIIHRDIKHKNILFDNRGSVKLIDFGLSNWACGGVMSFCGTPAYASPEMLLGTQYMGPEVDVWSLGILLYSLVTGKLPFLNVVDIVKQNYIIPPSLSHECADLIRKCLLIDLSKRATLNDIANHTWLTNTDTMDTFSDPGNDMAPFTPNSSSSFSSSSSNDISSSSSSITNFDLFAKRKINLSSSTTSSGSTMEITREKKEDVYREAEKREEEERKKDYDLGNPSEGKLGGHSNGNSRIIDNGSATTSTTTTTTTTSTTDTTKIDTITPDIITVTKTVIDDQPQEG